MNYISVLIIIRFPPLRHTKAFHWNIAPKKTDNIKRRALFALLITDLKTSSLSSNFNSGISGGRDTSIDPVDFQHWALLVHMEQGKLYLLYEASKDEATGKLRAYRADVSRAFILNGQENRLLPESMKVRKLVPAAIREGNLNR